MNNVEIFEGLEDLVKTISLGKHNYFFGVLQSLRTKQVQYKLSRQAYTSKVLVGLLKQEYETRMYSAGFTTDVSSYKYRQVIKQF